MHNYGTDLENIRIAFEHAGEHFEIDYSDDDYAVMVLHHIPEVEIVFDSRSGEMVEVNVLSESGMPNHDIRVNDVYKHKWSIIEWRVLKVDDNTVMIESDTKDCSMKRYKSDKLFIRENLIRRG